MLPTLIAEKSLATTGMRELAIGRAGAGFGLPIRAMSGRTWSIAMPEGELSLPPAGPRPLASRMNSDPSLGSTRSEARSLNHS